MNATSKEQKMNLHCEKTLLMQMRPGMCHWRHVCTRSQLMHRRGDLDWREQWSKGRKRWRWSTVRLNVLKFHLRGTFRKVLYHNESRLLLVMRTEGDSKGSLKGGHGRKEAARVQSAHSLGIFWARGKLHQLSGKDTLSDITFFIAVQLRK
ncbi:hypothetical protein IFM89_012719 [Coptis chinensis]|uniref:Uncharacterized protein n=1 Tax=Coptis chinensis TaxID=261450 RepID=A0A835HB13_9MAGN|nr:hypothetical protein IFM89_012719 [Coptis chinensis]